MLGRSKHTHQYVTVARRYTPPLPAGSTVTGFITSNQLAAFRTGSTWLRERCTVAGCRKTRTGEYVGHLAPLSYRQPARPLP